MKALIPLVMLVLIGVVSCTDSRKPIVDKAFTDSLMAHYQESGIEKLVKGDMDFWKKRLSSEHVPVEETPERFGRRVLRFADPDGLMLEFIEADHFDAIALNQMEDVPDEFALRGFHAPTLAVQLAKLTEQARTR